MATRTVILSVASRDDATARALAAFRGEAQGDRLSFASVERLWTVLTPRRWALLRALAGAGAGPVSIREAARRVGRDVKGVHADIHALLDAGLLERTEAGVRFPRDAVHVDFTLAAA